jgi:hypothetical protein
VKGTKHETTALREAKTDVGRANEQQHRAVENVQRIFTRTNKSGKGEQLFAVLLFFLYQSSFREEETSTLKKKNN